MPGVGLFGRGCARFRPLGFELALLGGLSLCGAGLGFRRAARGGCVWAWGGACRDSRLSFSTGFDWRFQPFPVIAGAVMDVGVGAGL